VVRVEGVGIDCPSTRHGVEIHLPRFAFARHPIERRLEIVARIVRPADVGADGVRDALDIVENLGRQHIVGSHESRRHMNVVENSIEVGRTDELPVSVGIQQRRTGIRIGRHARREVGRLQHIQQVAIRS
jgi:hypothetical protein